MTEEVVKNWGETAQALGWHPLEFFGCNPDPYAGRLDRDGLIKSLFGFKDSAEVVAVHADHVALRTGRDILHYRAFGPRGQVYLWDAYAPKGGP